MEKKEKKGNRRPRRDPVKGKPKKNQNKEPYVQVNKSTVRYVLPCQTLSISSTKRRMVVGGREIISILKIDTQENTLTVEHAFNRRKNKSRYSAVDVHWHPHDEERFVSSTLKGLIIVWNLRLINVKGGTQEHQFSGHEMLVNCVRWHPNETNLLLTGSADCNVKMWDLRKGNDHPGIDFKYRDKCRSVRFSPHNDNQFVACYDTGEFLIWDRRKQDKCVQSVIAHSGQQHCFSIDWHPEYPDQLLSCGRDKTIKVWSLRDTTEPEIEIKTTDVHKVAWVGNSHFASSSVVDKYVNLWHTNQSFVPVGTLRTHNEYVYSFEFCRDSHIITCSQDRTVCLTPMEKFSVPRMELPKSHVCFDHENCLANLSLDDITKPELSHKREFVQDFQDAIYFNPQIDLIKLKEDSKLKRNSVGEDSVFSQLAQLYKIRKKNTTIQEICVHNFKCARKVGDVSASQMWELLITLYPEEKEQEKPTNPHQAPKLARNNTFYLHEPHSKQSNMSTPNPKNSSWGGTGMMASHKRLGQKRASLEYLPMYGSDPYFMENISDDDLGDTNDIEQHHVMLPRVPKVSMTSELESDFKKDVVLGLFDAAVENGDVQSAAMLIITLRLDTNFSNSTFVDNPGCPAWYYLLHESTKDLLELHLQNYEENQPNIMNNISLENVSESDVTEFLDWYFKNLRESRRRRECLSHYINLVDRHGLQNEVSWIRKFSHDKAIAAETNNRTSMKLKCGSCEKALENGPNCTNPKCRQYVLCEICECLLLGPLLWSQDCGHAFHLQCAQKWFPKHIVCPCSYVPTHD